jgi:hypothetical protein
MGIVKDVLAFLVAVLKQWVVLMGGLIMTVITLVERERGNPISPKVYWPIIAGFVVAAMFLAWRTERRQWERLNVTKLSMTPKELVGVYLGRTDVQGKVLAKTYQGKWLEVSGELADVAIYGTFPSKVAALTFREFNSPSVQLWFNRKWISRLSMLSKGDNLTVLGQVESVEQYTVRVGNCEIINVPSKTHTNEEEAVTLPPPKK